MRPGRILNPGPLAFESDALPTALRDPDCQLLASLQLQVIE